MMTGENREPFVFFTRHNLTYLTGRKARNLEELAAGIREVPSSSIYHHTHHFLQQHEVLSPVPPNDFAYWITNVLGERILGEQVASIDLMEFRRLRHLRGRIVEVIESSLRDDPRPGRVVPRGLEFHFMKAQTFVFPTRCSARDLKEFRASLEKVSPMSLYYHMFEWRLRDEHPAGDFSLWLSEALGENSLAEKLTRIDPYTQTLDNLRRTLLRMIDDRLEERARA